MQIKFSGATETVTGSKHLVTTDKGYSILLDCGLYQGMGKETDALNRYFNFNPSDIDVVILSHAHIDHSGNLPLLIKQGFLGSIYCTPPTLVVVEVLLFDSAKIHEYDIEYVNKKREKKGETLLVPLYTSKDVERCLKHFKTVPYGAEFSLNDEASFTFSNAGHILGSAVVNLKLKAKTKRITSLTFTGDVGKYHDMLLKDPDIFPHADYIICESTYGDRLHEIETDAELHLLNVVKNTCVEKKGKLIIPAFSLGRTQEIVFILDKLKNLGMLPNIKVYVDSPMSTNVTNIMRDHIDCFNHKLQVYIKTDKDPFGFNNLKYITEKSESIELNNSKEPCIIISASGMMDAGRIKHHLKNNISDAKNTILVVGYCTPNSLGGKIRERQKVVKIFGDEYEVNADIEIIDSYSAHADYSELIRFLSCQDKQKVKKIFLVHGDPPAKFSFREKLISEGFKEVIIPHKNESFNID
ncbi:MAG: MBL fold metallo-hydrolase [Bacteroidia bacterium]|nr:MBL fold metallo-hydrolase [Bacteroidia bacterium]